MQVIEIIVRGESGDAVVIEGLTVKIIGAAFGDKFELAAGAGAKGRIAARYGGFQFLNGVERRIDRGSKGLTVALVVDVEAVESHVGLIRTRAGDGAFAISCLSGGLHDSRSEFEVKRGVIDEETGQVLHDVALHHGANAGIGGVQSFTGAGGHFDSGLGIAQFETDVAGFFVIDIENDAVETERAKSFTGERQGIVVSRRNVVERIDAAGIGLGGDREAGVGIGQRDVDADHHRALLVGDDAGQAGVGLSMQARAAQNQQSHRDKNNAAQDLLNVSLHSNSPRFQFSEAIERLLFDFHGPITQRDRN